MILILFCIYVIVRDVSVSQKEDGEYLTGAYMGPFVYQGEVYLRSDLNSFPESENTEILGCVRENWRDCLSLVNGTKGVWKCSRILLEIGEIRNGRI